MASANRAILALDLGTSELKGGLVTIDGRLAAVARAAYPLDVDAATGRAEADPGSWWRAIVAVVGELVAEDPSAGRTEVAAIVVVGHGPSLVPLGPDAEPSHPAITWLDRRPAADAAALETASGRSGWSLGILPAARWLERTAPSAAARTSWYLTTWEWAALRLSGTAAATVSLGQESVDRGALIETGLAVDRLPPEVPVGAIVGHLLPSTAADLDLPAGIPVVAGTVDSFASFHGAGLVDPGDAVDTGGTSGGLAVYWDAPVEVAGSWLAHAPLPDRWFLGGAMTATGRALEWFGSSVLGGVPTEHLVLDAAAIEPGAGGLVFLPYLAGERSPLWDPTARGAFIGLTLDHGRGHLGRAILEAAAFALRHVAAPILANGVRIDRLTVTGGTARSEVWNRIKADVLGVPVVVPEILDAAILGGAIIGATAIGAYDSLGEAIRSTVRAASIIPPDPARRAVYDAAFEAYVGAWPAIAPTVRRLTRAD